MTSAEAVLRMRFILSEVNPSSSPFYTDTDLYRWLDGGQNQVVTILLGKERKGPGSQDSLRALLKLQQITVVAGTFEYALPADYIASYLAMCIFDNTLVFKYCTQEDYAQATLRDNNAYMKASLIQPLYYINGNVIGVKPTPLQSAGPGLNHTYYAQPAVVALGQNFTLFPECHEAILFFAVAEALTKEEGRSQESQMYYTKALNLINLL
jgi:hypothetical protein